MTENCRTNYVPYQTTPITTVALKLTSSAEVLITPKGSISSSPSQYRLPLFQPQLCPVLNVSGELVNRVRAAPVALPHSIAKYARMAGRGSRYGCTVGPYGTGGEREVGEDGVVLLLATEVVVPAVPGREDPVPGREPPVPRREPGAFTLASEAVVNKGEFGAVVLPEAAGSEGSGGRGGEGIGADDGNGSGSTLDCLCRYTPSCQAAGPCGGGAPSCCFFRTTCTYTLNKLPAYHTVCECSLGAFAFAPFPPAALIERIDASRSASRLQNSTPNRSGGNGVYRDAMLASVSTPVFSLLSGELGGVDAGP